MHEFKWGCNTISNYLSFSSSKVTRKTDLAVQQQSYNQTSKRKDIFGVELATNCSGSEKAGTKIPLVEATDTSKPLPSTECLSFMVLGVELILPPHKVDMGI